MNHYCTLFDSGYLPQGLALYQSLLAHTQQDFHLTIFAFDDRCYQLLSALNLSQATVVPLSDFETPELLAVKPTRKRGEYCWTCTSATILDTLNRHGADQCTYLDADLYFYGNPNHLLQEMFPEDAILITEHRYSPRFDQTEISGKYCVQFISFKNNAPGLEALKWWYKACLDWCYDRPEDGKFGDQKYLDDWQTRFKGVHVLEHFGGGLGPWNIDQYSLEWSNEVLVVTSLENPGKQKPAMFYHFHNVKFDNTFHFNWKAYAHYKISAKTERLIYRPYLQRLSQISKQLRQLDKTFPLYQPYPDIRHVPLKFFRLKFLDLMTFGAIA